MASLLDGHLRNMVFARIFRCVNLIAIIIKLANINYSEGNFRRFKMRNRLAIIIVLIALFGCGGGGTSYNDYWGPSTRAVPPGGTYTSPQNVTLEVYKSGAGGHHDIYYTTDGSDPTTASTVFTELIPITKNTTIKFFGTSIGPNGIATEPVNTEIYVILP
jgi:hypothetical protein